MKRTCLCEHASHWAPVDDEHGYQQYRGEDVDDVTTPFGVFPMCAACRELQHDKPMMGRDSGRQVPLISSPAVLPLPVLATQLSPVANAALAAFVLVVIVIAAIVVLMRGRRP